MTTNEDKKMAIDSTGQRRHPIDEHRTSVTDAHRLLRARREVRTEPALWRIQSLSLPGKIARGTDGRQNVHPRRCRTREISDSNRSPIRRSVRPRPRVFPGRLTDVV